MTAIKSTKFCSKCKLIKPTTDFRTRKGRKDVRYLEAWCKNCKDTIKRLKSKIPLTFPTELQIEKFWKQVNKTDKCWLWTGLPDENGYGIFGLQYRNVLAHRLSFWIEYGHLPKNDACHTCDTPSCVNPYHLFDGTHAENMADMVRKGRTRKGDNHWANKLTSKDIIEIKKLLLTDIVQNRIAERFNISPSIITGIKKGIMWTHIT